MKRTTKEYWVQSRKVDDVVQFNENSIKYLETDLTALLGIVSEIKSDKYLVGVVIPERGIAYYLVPQDCLEYIGPSHFIVEIKDSQQN